VRRKILTFFTASAMVAALNVAVAPTASGVTFTVTTLGDTTPDGTCDATHCTLREAVIAANATPAVADFINIPRGIVTLQIPGDDAVAEFGDLDITSKITITGNGIGNGVQSTTVDQTAPGERVFDVLGTGNLLLFDLSVTGGSVPLFTFGGGVRVNDPVGELFALRVRFADNVAAGGGIGSSGTAVVEEAIFENNGGNDTSLQGAGILSNGFTQITRSVFRNNTAGNVGGAVMNAGGTMIIQDDTSITGNTSAAGAGSAVENTSDGTMTIDETEIADNTSGGISSSGPSTALTVTDSTISGHSSPNQGGGIFINSADANAIRNTTISGNSSEVDGGGVFGGIQAGGSLQISHATITDNTSNSDSSDPMNIEGGGGLRTLVNGPVSIVASVIVGNTDVGSAPSPNATNDCSSGFASNTSLGDNVFGEPGTTTTCAFPVNVNDVTEASNDGWLLPLADNGGPTRTHGLSETAPALDLQAPGGTGCQAGNDDQRGFSRPVDSGCDAGSLERDAGPRADEEIRLAGAATYLGDGTFNATGAGQTVTTKTKKNKTAVFEIKVKNVGNDGDTFDLGLCRAVKGFTVAFRDADLDVPLTGTPSFNLAPAATKNIEVAVTVKAKGKPKLSCLMKATPQDNPSAVDAVLAVVKAKRPRA
jgi:CSLREA domain-containing protein